MLVMAGSPGALASIKLRIHRPLVRQQRNSMAFKAQTTSQEHTPANQELVTHKGGCHCCSVRFEFQGDPDLVAWDCNCSLCAMKRNTHVIVPSAQFTILQGGASSLTEYQFGSKTARHFHCKHCGVTPFYIPRSNPDGYAVTAACIETLHIKSLTVKKFDGKNWEQSFSATGIGALSK